MSDFYMKYTEMLQKVLRPFGRNLMYLLASLPFGIIYFTFVVTGISLGFGLSIIYIGIPILVGTLIYAEKIVA